MRSRGPLSHPEAWLDVFARIGDGVRRAVLPLSGTEAGREAHQLGAGGDTTVEVDRAAEAVVFNELAALAEGGETFSVLSEEAGHRDFGAALPLILVDPVDGSLNAKQGVPVYGLMLAVLDGPKVADTLAGLVMNLATGQTMTAVRGHGARRDGEPLRVLERADPSRIELLGLESTPRALKVAAPLVERAAKVRILGSMAISISLVASGGLDVFSAPMPVRVFDMAASLLLLREAGGVATTIEGRPLGDLPCDLNTRATLLCAPNRQLHEEALRILGAHV
ncbi:MAG TPA: inositol monophosphatase family protein [Candidatus Dormibacteraeota bacterium]|nr:inositol monophosphatase family protein [Candidatus Dormibacteraeota bacterium]